MKWQELVFPLYDGALQRALILGWENNLKNQDTNRFQTCLGSSCAMWWTYFEYWGEVSVLRSLYMIEGYFPKGMDDDFETGLIRESVGGGRKLHRVFMTDRFGCWCDTRNSFALAPGSKEEGGFIWLLRVLLSFTVGVRWRTETGEYSSSQFVETKTTMNIVEETLVVVRLKWSTDDEADKGLKQVASSLKQRGISAWEWFAIERCRTLHDCLNVLKMNHAIEPCLEKTTCLFHRS